MNPRVCQHTSHPYQCLRFLTMPCMIVAIAASEHLEWMPNVVTIGEHEPRLNPHYPGWNPQFGRNMYTFIFIHMISYRTMYMYVKCNNFWYIYIYTHVIDYRLYIYIAVYFFQLTAKVPSNGSKYVVFFIFFAKQTRCIVYTTHTNKNLQWEL